MILKLNQTAICLLAFGCEPIHSRLPPLAIFLASVPKPKTRSWATRPLLGPRSHDLPYFHAISRTLPRQLPSSVQIGFAWLPRLSAVVRPDIEH